MEGLLQKQMMWQDLKTNVFGGFSTTKTFKSDNTDQRKILLGPFSDFINH